MLPTSSRVSRGHRRLAPGITQAVPKGLACTNVSLGLTCMQPKRRGTGTLECHKRCPIHWPATKLSRCL